MAKDVPEDPEQREACEISLQTLLGEEQMTQIQNDETKMEEANSWFQACQEHVRCFAKFVVQTKGKDDLATILAASSLPKMPVKHKHWAILYDTKTSGESSSQPNCRVPQFRKDHFRKCVHACLKARGEDDMEANALVLVLDGWRSLDLMITNSLVTVENGEANDGPHQDHLPGHL